MGSQIPQWFQELSVLLVAMAGLGGVAFVIVVIWYALFRQVLMAANVHFAFIEFLKQRKREGAAADQSAGEHEELEPSSHQKGE